ncbi:NUDIX hydrolase [Oceaniglobus indicus]|uniref:NUDIX hydrolase n=1 Tax=Oceaniglobus indicus TaxID=2047749 RepID=UPI000C1A4315|nr:NUDIX hydrolase [Oceaniglobus indicus]
MARRERIEKQIAALPLRWDDEGRMRVLMVTSRGTGRWIVPKGWLMDGKKPWRAAEIEALEEAGAVGAIGSEPLGDYRYRKTLDDGSSLPIRVRLYPLVVERLKKRWKERDERKRKWFSVKGAARRVDEPELRDMLLSLVDKPKKVPAIREVLKAS